MKSLKTLSLLIGIISLFSNNLKAQIGYYDAPYTRYEADVNSTLANGAAATTATYDQSQITSEASRQICVKLPNTNASIEWSAVADGDGLVIRYSIPISGNHLSNDFSALQVWSNGSLVTTLTLNTYYSWEYLQNNGDVANNTGVVNTNYKMRFDEVRYKLPSKLTVGQKLKLVRTGSNDIYIDFVELEPVPAAYTAASVGADVTYSGPDLQTFVNNNPGKKIFLPTGYYSMGTELAFTSDNTKLYGAGMWYTEIHFTGSGNNAGGLRAAANGVSYSGLYLGTDRNARTNSYKGINGVYTSTSLITEVWAEHFECGAWIAKYFGGGPTYADGFKMNNCRFRNNYADGINLCYGTSNSIVEHCSFRNNGDDDMAIWPASGNGQEGQGNTFRYNTSENCWRASGCAIYGGKNNQAHHLLIRDNVEVGIRVNNSFGGYSFDGSGSHTFSNIRIERCGTSKDLFNTKVGAIDLLANSVAGTQIINVTFSCIEIIDSKNDAIYINRVNSGDGFYGLVFQNITIDGTGREYGTNGAGTSYGILFAGNPSGNATYCGITFANRAGSAGANVVNSGSISWNTGTCPGGCVPLTNIVGATTITSASSFAPCQSSVTVTATSTIPTGLTVTSIQFYANGTSLGTDNSSPYQATWNNPPNGTDTIKAVTTYSDGSTSQAIQSVAINGIYPTAVAPAMTGANPDALWSNYRSFALAQTPVGAGNITSSADLSASYKIIKDNTNVYIYIDVNDSNVRFDGDANLWQEDAVEIYFDMGNNKATTYDANDYSFTIAYGGGPTPTGLTVHKGTTTDGYFMEIQIPWTSLGLAGSPANNTDIGFDIHVDDDDGPAGNRDSKIAWNETADEAWRNPSYFGTLRIASCSAFLPVDLISFTGARKSNKSALNWATAKEENNNKFIIERSVNSHDWIAVGEIAGAKNSTSIVEYTFVDEVNYSGTLYYRLKQVDIDGASEYSHIIAIQGEDQLASVSPNPFSNDGLNIRGNVSGPINISIHDLLGRLVFQTEKESENGLLTIQPDLSAGTFIITLKTETFVKQEKIIKQ